MTFLPAEKDRPRRGPVWPWQGWADRHPQQVVLLMGLLVALALALVALELVDPSGPGYFFVALCTFVAVRAAWIMWRQSERTKKG